jgi:hypothetical protein
MKTTNVWVVIPAHRPAIGTLKENLALLGDLAARTVVVTNGQHPITEHELPQHIIQAGMEINISRWWNLGLDWIWEQETDPSTGKVNRHHVLILNADARIRPQGVARLSWALDTNRGFALAHPKAGVGIDRVHVPGPYGLQVRMTGWCFMLTSDVPIRADEQFNWWFGDDDVEWRAAQEGGVLRVGRVEAAHLGDGTPRGDLARIAREDMARGEEKWSIRPW